jgi:hypothetical protein
MEDRIAQSLKVVIDQGRDYIQHGYYGLTPNEEFVTYVTRQGQLAHFPSIEIVRDRKEVEWFSTRFRKETYRFYIDCSVKSLSGEGAKRDIGTELLNDFASSVENWINEPRNIGYHIEGTDLTTMDGLANSLDPNYRRGFGLRSARIGYWTFILNHANGKYWVRE